jgi:hypothetical protein
VWGGQCHRVDDQKQSPSSTARYYRVVSIIFSPRRFQSEFIFQNSQLSHEFTTFAQIHDFCMSSYVEFSRIHDFRTNSRLLHDFTTHTTKKSFPVSRTGLTNQRSHHLSHPRAWYIGVTTKTIDYSSLLNQVISTPIQPTETPCTITL